MVAENFLNLLEDFEKQKNYELLLFTTYSFDAYFFDNVLLRVLKQNNPGSEIIILVDAEHYPKPQESTDATGVEYALIPIPHAVFHPKLFLFYSKKGSLVYVGSHNLTLSGFTHNLELCCKLSDEEVITDSLEYVLLSLQEVFDKDNHWVKRIEEILKERPQRLEKTTFLIHNFNSPILHKALGIIKQKETGIERATVIAPFFSGERHLLSLMHSTIGVDQIVVCIQRYNHNLDVDNVISLPFVTINEVLTKDNRRIHLKSILFETPKEKYLLMGSPNFTINALDRTVGMGNFEVAMMLNLQDDSLFEELEFKTIRREEALETKRADDTRLALQTKTAEVFLTASYLDIFNRLVLNFKAPAEEKEFTLNIHHPRAEKIEVHINLGKSTKSLVMSVSSKILTGSYVWLTDSTGNTVSNIIRIYNPGEQGVAARYYGVDFKEIPELIANSRQLEEMLQIIAALFTGEKIEHGISEKKYSPAGPSPGRIISTESSEDILEAIKNLLRIPRVGTVHARAEQLPPSGSTRVDQIEEVRRANLDDEIENILGKLARAFEVRLLSKNNSPLMYSIYTLIALKLLEFVTQIKRKEMLRRQVYEVSELLRTYGISKEKQEDELLTFLSTLIHVRSQVSADWRDVVRRLLGRIEPILFSEDNALKGLQFADSIPIFLEKVKLQPGNVDEYRKAIALIISEIIREKNSRIQTDFVKKLTYQMLILSGSPPHADHRKALFAFRILEKVLSENPQLKTAVKLILERNKDTKGFRRTLVDDILKI